MNDLTQNAAVADESELPETSVLSATDENVENQTTTSLGEDDNDEIDNNSSDGKIDSKKVNEIVQRRVEKVRSKTRTEVEAQYEEELEFWRNKASTVKPESQPILELPPKPAAINYASNPQQYEIDMEKWASLKATHESQQQKIVDSYNKKSAAFAAETPDYEKSVKFFNAVTVPKALEASILESDIGPQIAYYLSKNFKEFDRISNLSPTSQLKEVAKLELKLSGQTVEPIKQVKQAPKPVSTVTGSAPVVSKVNNKLETAEDRQKFIEARKLAHRRGGR